MDLDIEDWHKTSLLADDQAHDSFDSTLTDLLTEEQDKSNIDYIKLESTNL